MTFEPYSARPGVIRQRLTIGALAALLSALSVSAAPPALDQEITFGVKMAQRGLWSEALFRFKRAADQRPNDGRVLNNLAVAYEAVGEFDKALETYQRALQNDASNRELKSNYSRFIEFYQAFKPPEEETTSDEEVEPQTDPSPPPPSPSDGQ